MKINFRDLLNQVMAQILEDLTEGKITSFTPLDRQDLHDRLLNTYHIDECGGLTRIEDDDVLYYQMIVGLNKMSDKDIIKFNIEVSKFIEYNMEYY